MPSSVRCVAPDPSAKGWSAEGHIIRTDQDMQGSSKTLTCVDVLAGRKTVGTIKGTVVYAGHKPSRSFLRRYTGYVEQFGELSLPSPPCLSPPGLLHDNLS